jgi:hypothetical protein
MVVHGDDIYSTTYIPHTPHNHYHTHQKCHTLLSSD